MKGFLFVLIIFFSSFSLAQDLPSALLKARELSDNSQHREVVSLLSLEIEKYKTTVGIDSLLISALMVQGKSSVYQWKWEDAEIIYEEAMELSASLDHEILYAQSAIEYVTVLSFLNKQEDKKPIRNS